MSSASYSLPSPRFEPVFRVVGAGVGELMPVVLLRSIVVLITEAAVAAEGCGAVIIAVDVLKFVDA